MKKFLTLGLVLITTNLFAVTGFYQTIDDKTNMPRSIVKIFEYDDGKIGGRIVAMYDTKGNIEDTIVTPTRRSTRLSGNPHLSGLDILWELRHDGKEYSGGRIMDPQSGSAYRARIWQENPAHLSVRGQLGIGIGRTQTWNTLDTAALPAELRNLDTSAWTPTPRN